MMKFLTQKLLVLALLVTSLTAPTAYAQDQAARSTSPRTASQNNADARKRIPTDLFVRTELFFGSDRPEGPDVTEEDFRLFLNDVVTPEFPDGLTLITGTGQFRGSDNVIVREESFVLVLLYPLETRDSSSEKIEKIRKDYKEYFQQQSVLRVDDPRPVRVSF